MAKRGTWGGARPGSGPKPGPPELVRSARLVVRFTDAELSAIESAADGEALATWCRATLLRAAKRRPGR